MQKRNRSPEEKDSRSHHAKKTQRREAIINKRRGINTPEQNTSSNIETNNSFALLDVELGEATVKRTPKPPPIILYGVDDLAKLTQLIEEVIEKNDYTYKIVSKNQLIISSNTVDKYKILIEHIRSKGLIGHTFTRKDQKCMRIVIKHLHFSTPKDAIIEAVEKTGNKVQGEIVTARKQGTKEPLNTFLCVKCAGAHKTTTCTINDNTPAVCALCSGSHPASYKGCQVYREVLARKKIGNKFQPYPKSKTTLEVRTKNSENNEPPNDTDVIVIEPDNHSKTTQPKHRLPSVKESLGPYSEAPKNSTKTVAYHTETQKSYTRDNTDQTKQQIHRKDKVDHIDSQRTNTENHVDHESQRTYLRKIELGQENRFSLEALIVKQTERIDQLISQLSTMMNLIMTIISRLPQ
ncbi:uncharacterized protein LOC125055560 [Pieris napi]|uniref:uncharacterized protein LOC125055560 n=1 Tax=Pieris napi TaxID=78633 RepID=UPI001FBAD8FC|nr:uncharacterized protein LOC125055560 [Pieris napi]